MTAERCGHKSSEDSCRRVRSLSRSSERPSRLTGINTSALNRNIRGVLNTQNIHFGGLEELGWSWAAEAEEFWRWRE